MSRKKTKKTKIILLLVIIIVIAIFIKSFIEETFAKFASQASGETTVYVAALDFYLTEQENVKFEKIYPTADVQEYRFNVSNDGDIQMIYTITIETEQNLPLNYKVYRIEGENEIEEKLINYSSDEIEIGIKEKQEYIVRISWSETDEDYKYNNEVDCIKIVLNSYQKEPKGV